MPESASHPASPPSRTDRLLAALSALVAAVALWAAWRTAHAGDDIPDDVAWQRAAALVRAQLQPGDLITFAPAWIDPVGRLHLGDRISVADAGRADAARYPRVWVLAIRGASSPEVRGETPAYTQRTGGILVRRYDKAPAQILGDALRALPSAKISGALASGPQVVLAEVGFAPRRCVQVEPVAGGTVRLEFPAFPLGSQLVVHAGLADVFTRRDVREPGRLEILLDGRSVATRDLAVTDDAAGGWQRLAVTTTPGLATVTVLASAPSPRAHRRLICFALESRQ